jgi:hypothetical protein
VISICLTTFSVISINGNFFTDYLNPFNWIAFFGIGVMIKNRKVEIDKYTNINFIKQNKSFYGLFSLFVIILSVLYFNSNDISYWGCIFSLPFELLACFIVLTLSQIINNNRLLISIGKNSLVIYLLHLPLADIVNAKLQLSGFLFFIKPLLVIAFFHFFIWTAFNVTKILKIEKYLFLFGIKEI